MIRRTVLFSGRVQGVGFRYTACRVATAFEVTGRVRNLADGRVEAVIEGAPEEIDAFVQALSDEMAGYIRDTQSRDGPATAEFADFDVRF
jgi:acylphosphatase